jgi:peptide/nickel transport system permease protein
MLPAILLRVAAVVPTLIVASIIVFGTINLVPGRASGAFLGIYQTPQARAAFDHRYGLDRPLPVQYVDWITGVLHGDFSRSLESEVPIGPELLSRVSVTLELALLAMLIAVTVSLPLGVAAAWWRGQAIDRLVSLLAVGGMSMPNFLLATVLVLVVAIKLKVVPPGGFIPFRDDPLANLLLMAMPAVSLGLISSTILLRIMRSSMIEVLEADYIRAAVAKGVSPFYVVVRHGLRNALAAFLAIAGVEFGALFGGAVIIEHIFLLPGVGSYVLQGIQTRDARVLEAGVLTITFVVIVVNLVVDLLGMLIDPRRSAAQS